MGSLYIYVVDRDFGFAPNPFHGYCTLATCKPKLRASVQIGDWIMGVGGCNLKATGRCVYLMRVSEIINFNDYWSDARFQVKKPLRNGSKIMMVGDNIYHRKEGDKSWIQEDSHHSNPDGSPNADNIKTDTSSNNVLISDHFYYFGKAAPEIDLTSIGFKNHIGHSKKPLGSVEVANFLTQLEQRYKKEINLVQADPFDFFRASKRVNQVTGKVT